MNRREVAGTLAAVVQLGSDLVHDAEDEIDKLRATVGELRAENGHLKARVFDLEGRLHEEQVRRAKYQAVDAAARRYVAKCRVQGTASDHLDCVPKAELFQLLSLIPE